jgi:hypothetical protein
MALICFPAPASLHCMLDLFPVPSTFLEGSLLHTETTQAALHHWWDGERFP